MRKNQSQRILNCNRFMETKGFILWHVNSCVLYTQIIFDLWNPEGSWTWDWVTFMWYKSLLHLVRQMPSGGGVEQHPCIWAHLALVERFLRLEHQKGESAWNCVCVLWEWNSRFWVKIYSPGITEIWGRPCMKQGGDVRMARVCWHSTRKMKKYGRGGREMGLQGPRDLNNCRASLGSIPCDSRGEVGGRMLLV